MLRYAFRRLLWLFPSVLGVSLISFFVLARVPLPRESSEPSDRADSQAEMRGRQRFVDLPLFFNIDPKDVRARSMQAVDRLVTSSVDSAAGERGRRELVRLGGAALPVVLPQLDSLSPGLRSRIALALAPLVDRMGIEHEGELSDPERAVVFWNRFWESRGVEFREATARSAVRRYLRYGTEARAKEILVLDTFALPVMMDALSQPEDAESLEQTRRLVDLIAHVTTSNDRIGPDDSLEEASACVQRWRRWWTVYQADYVQLTGAERVAAFALETRYGKWILETVVLRVGKDAQGRPLLAELARRARVTFGVLLLGMALAYLFAIPLGTLSAHFRARPVDRMVSVMVLLPYALSPAVLAVLALGLGAEIGASGGWAALLLGCVLLADPTRHQRAELLPVLASDYVRAAVARGAGPVRVLVVHGLRNAAIPVVTRFALEFPMALSACFVLEHVFGLDGMGAATVAAVREGDTGWLMAIAVLGTAWAVIALVLSDVVYALLDPRMQQRLLRLQGRRH